MGEHVIRIIDKTERAYTKWQEEGPEGVRVWGENKGIEAKPWRTCALCKKLQEQMGMWTQRFEVKCFRLKREQWGKDKLTEMSVKSLMALAVVEAQVPQKVTYSEEGTTRRGPAVYKIAYEFPKGAPKDIKEKIPIHFLWHVMQHAISLEEETGPDSGYSEYKIRHFPCRVEIKFLKYGGLCFFFFSFSIHSLKSISQTL